jgi:hypothetical protein
MDAGSVPKIKFNDEVAHPYKIFWLIAGKPHHQNAHYTTWGKKL